ncbi:MAG: hypothetical protein JXA33_04955 [Anaerolineae bacterium]|nr:hypothetical protein [Anaerolineae bacterium]
MNNKIFTRKMDWAGDKRLRLKRDLSQTPGSFGDITRNRIVGGVILLIGWLGLIGFLVQDNQFVAVIAATGLFIGSLMFISPLLTMGPARHSVNTFRDWQRIASYVRGDGSGEMGEVIFLRIHTDGVAGVRTESAEFEAQLSVAE